jgi:hypothetical protein
MDTGSSAYADDNNREADNSVNSAPAAMSLAITPAYAS